jgi:uracil-DNA glycosylase
MTDTTKLLQQKLHERLKNSGWADVLKSFTLSEDFLKVLGTLEQEVADGKRFTPPLKQVFSAFENCPARELKVVLVYDEPSYFFGVADGMAFSGSNQGTAEPCLRHLFRELGTPNASPDLKRWAEQGVLLLNQSLTTRIGKAGKHHALWQPFLAFLVDQLSYRHKNLVWVMLGPDGETIPELINNDDHLVLHYPPVPRLLNQEWNGLGLFEAINDCLKAYGKEQVAW